MSSDTTQLRLLCVKSNKPNKTVVDNRYQPLCRRSLGVASLLQLRFHVGSRW
jgi:hypothetical protein